MLVDENDLAQQFTLEEGRIGALSVSLPESVEDVAFNPVGSRVYFRTARWVHRVSSSTNGLIWLDAILAPRPVHGGNIIVAAATSEGNEIQLPVTRGGSLTLARLRYDAAATPGLFGNRDELIEEWRAKLGLAMEARWGTAATATAGVSD